MPYKNREDTLEYSRAYHAKFDAITYHAHKRMKSCVNCGEKDAFTLNGRARCAECTKKRNDYARARYEETKGHKNERRRELYEERKAKGICTRCGKRVPEAGHTRCDHCRAKQRSKYIPALPTPDGICVNCKKEPVLDGFQLCEQCYRNVCAALKKGRERVNRDCWRKTNQLFFGGEA